MAITDTGNLIATYNNGLPWVEINDSGFNLAIGQTYYVRFTYSRSEVNNATSSFIIETNTHGVKGTMFDCKFNLLEINFVGKSGRSQLFLSFKSISNLD